MQPSALRASLVAAACSFGLVLPAVAQTAGTGTAGAPSGEAAKSGLPSSKERDFVLKAAMAGMAEVELGELAQQKASSDAVRKFGARMVQDHGQANDELKAIAASKGVQLPTEPDAKHKAALQKLQKLSGSEFDRAYMDRMVADHEETVGDFRKQAVSGKDPELNGFATSMLPKLEQHLRMAESTRGAIKASKGRAEGKAY